MATTNGIGGSSTPRITLYTNHGCPFAHRVHIAIKELGLSYEEVIIDLDKPREEWYLKVNPRGLVPSLKYNDEIIIESSIVAQFLADAHPSHLAPPSNAPGGALARARMAFFADTWSTKVQPVMFSMFRAPEKAEEIASEVAAAIKKEIEPLLDTAKPYFGGSDTVTMAEVMIAPPVIRLYAYSRAGLFPQSLIEQLDALPNFSKWAKTLTHTESVIYIWDEQKNIEGIKRKMEQTRKTHA